MDALYESMQSFINMLLVEDVSFVTLENGYSNITEAKKDMSAKQKKYQALIKKVIVELFGKGKKMNDLSKSEKAKLYRSLEKRWQTDEEKAEAVKESQEEDFMLSKVSVEQQYAKNLLEESYSMLENASYRSKYKNELMSLNVVDPMELNVNEQIRFFMKIK